MQRYFFHIQTDSRDTDVEGIVLNSPIEALRQAIQTCGQIIADAPDRFWGSRPWTVIVTNLSGAVLWEITTDVVPGPAAPV